MKCNICNSIDVSIIIKRKDKYDYYRCNECALVFSEPMPTNGELEKYYNGFVFNLNNVTDSYVENISDDVDGIMSVIKGYEINSNSVLDYGGGIGLYALAFLKHFDRVDLYEVDTKAIEYASNISEKKINIVTKKDLLEKKEKYDLVFINQVIEHLVDFNELFEIIKTITHKDSLVIITTPNNKSFEYIVRPYVFGYYISRTISNVYSNVFNSFVKFVTNSWVYCDPPRHVYAFNEFALKILVENNSFKCIDVFTEYSNKDVFSGGRLRYQSDDSSFFKHIVKRIYFSMQNILLSFISACDRNDRYGDNLIIIVKKNS